MDNRLHCVVRNVTIATLLIIGMCLTGCPSSGRMAYQKGMALLQAQDYAGALAQFEKSLIAEPDSVMPLYGKARCLYGLKRYQEALPIFEDVLAKTEREKTLYSDTRYDAAFYRDKCKQELGQEVPQNPENIPPPPMGE